MRLFACDNCASALHFENRHCGACGHRVGLRPSDLSMRALAFDEQGGLTFVADAGMPARFCANASADLDVCNWLVEDEGEDFCVACRHNRLVPNLGAPQGLERWRAIGRAERHLFYSLLRLRLPHPDRREDPQGGLIFDFLEDKVGPDGTVTPAMTGHEDGLIAIRVAEADDAVREQTRIIMREPYRTLLGHFRHETGHFIWDKLVRDRNAYEGFRAVFGDERPDYGEALQAYYAHGAPLDWRERFISPYSSSHPWEDFAETFAHYLHIVDTLETARAFGLQIDARGHDGLTAEVDFQPYRASSARRLVDAWIPMTVAINEIQRSMGEPDSYPFVLSPPVVEKLEYIRALIRTAAEEPMRQAA